MVPIAGTTTAQTTLTASLGLSPQGGQSPLNVTLTASVSGNATGTINYTFYCDRSDTGTDITQGFVSQINNTMNNPQSAICAYTVPGTYTPKVIVQRGSGAAQALQLITVTQQLPPPTITSIQPSSTSAGPTSQFVTIVGNNFQAGVTLTLVAPGGNAQTFTGSQLQNFSSATFQVSAILNVAGGWTVRVTNPDGQSATGTISVLAQASLTFNFTNWSPVFTLGDSSATIGLQIIDLSGGFTSGSVSASTSNGSPWLTVDGHASDTWNIVPSSGSLTTSVSLTANPSGLSAGTYTGTVVVSAPNASNPTTTILVTMTILTPLQITTTSLPTASWGQPYNYQLQASGGSGYSWSLQSGSALPPNLSLSTSGLISGTLIAGSSNNSYPITFLVMDSRNRSQYVNLVLYVQATITVTTNAPSSFQFAVGQNYVLPSSGNNSIAFQANGGTPPYSWSSSGLPPGLHIDPSSGTVVGTPTQPGAFTATITAIDSTGRTGSGIFTLTVVTTPILITTGVGQSPPTLGSGMVGVPYSQFLAVTGGSNAGYQWSVTGLPPGLSGSINTNASCTSSCSYQIAGKPTQMGNYTVVARVTDSLNNSATAGIQLAINSGTPPTITTSTLALATVGQSYSATFSANGGTPPYQWSFAGASPDSGLQLLSTGTLQGTSTVPNDCLTGPGAWIGTQPPFGTFSPAYFQVQVTDSAGQSANRQFCLPAYYPTPVISGFNPSSLTVNGQNTTITVSGSYFRNQSILVGNGVQFSPSFVGSTALTFTLSPSTSAAYSVSGTGFGEGTHPLWVVQPYSYSSNQNKGFAIYDPLPVISSVQAVLNNSNQPCTGNSNCQLVITGSGFVFSTQYQAGSQNLGTCLAQSPSTGIPWNNVTTCAFSLPSGTYTLTVTNYSQPSGSPATATIQFTVH